jgi:hypothetical protein
MKSFFWKLSAFVLIVSGWTQIYAEQRNEVSYLRGPYNIAFFQRHNEAFRVGAALHFSHAKQHDVLLLTPFSQREPADASFDQESLDFLKELKAKTEPVRELLGVFFGRLIGLICIMNKLMTSCLRNKSYGIKRNNGLIELLLII